MSDQKRAPVSPRALPSSLLPASPSAAPVRQPFAESPFTRLSLAEYVRSKGGEHAISRVLIANNGIAAVKAIRSIRRWAYETFGNDKVIEFVVMATPEDIKANAAYIHLADEFVAVPGGTNNNNYANVMLITELAERCNAHAVWAGWGHASENPKLPESLSAIKSHKVIWIGPPPEAMRALGDKIGSTLIAQSAGVPCMDWSGTGLTVDYAKSGIPKELYLQACVSTTEEAVQAAEKIGYPIMIKASEGGGGKGIRKVENSEAVRLAFGQVQGEVPGSPIFLMRLAPSCRHLEVQLLADAHGEAIAVFGRDCSIQRRHQKIIEEGPVVAAPPPTWKRMEQSAVRLAKEVGYIGAGTVEYLYTDSGDYYFLELNPRLQVEHPVTELISGVNLPAAQLQVAMGIPLHHIRGVRRMFGFDPATSSPIDFANTNASLVPGSVIACRVTAENPDAEFQPTSGVIQELNFRSTPDVWGYFSVSAKGGVHEYSDSQFGHMFALGETREIARRNMVLALKELSIRGDIRTTVEYLRRVLETDDFRNNRITTNWLEKIMAQKKVITEKPETHLAVLLGALARAVKFQTAREKEYMDIIDRGQLPTPTLHSEMINNRIDLIYEKTKYRFHITRIAPSSYNLQINEWSTVAEIHPLSDEGLLVLLDSKKYVVYAQEFPSGLRLTVDGKTCLFHEEYDPTQLRSSMPGKLVRYVVDDGARLNKDQVYAEIEVMKMYITLTAPEGGVLKYMKSEGAILEAGDLIASLILDHPERVQKAELFTGSFPTLRGPTIINDNPNLLLKASQQQLLMLLAGYEMSSKQIETSLNSLMNCLRDPRLPLEQFREILSTLSSRLPSDLYEELSDRLVSYANDMTAHRFYWENPEPFPVLELKSAIDKHCLSYNPSNPIDALKLKALNLQLTTAGVYSLLNSYKDGNHTYAVQILTKFLEEYVSVEQYYNLDERAEYVIKSLRKIYKDDICKVAAIARAHYQLSKRNHLVITLLDVIDTQFSPLLPEFIPHLRKLSFLSNREVASVVLRARQLIMREELPSSSQRRIAIQTILNAAGGVSSNSEQRRERLAPLIDQSQPIEDLIFSFFENKRTAIQAVAMEAYIRRVYQVYAVPNVEVHYEAKSQILIGRWEFCMVRRNEEESNNTNPLQLKITEEKAPSKVSSFRPSSLHLKPSDEYALSRLDSVTDIAMLAQSNSPTPNFSTARSLSSAVRRFNSSPRSSPIGPSASGSNLVALGENPIRQGLMCWFKDFDSLKKNFEQCILSCVDATAGVMLTTAVSAAAAPGGAALAGSVASIPSAYPCPSPSSSSESVHVVYVGFKWSGRLPADETLSTFFRTFVLSQSAILTQQLIRRVTFIVASSNSTTQEEYPMYFTYRHRMKFEEDPLIRHIEPSYARHMQLSRLSNFDIRFVPTTNRMVHLFAAYPAAKSANGVALLGACPNPMFERPLRPSDPYDGRRLFVRSIIRKLDSLDMGITSSDVYADVDLDAHPETEVAFMEALNALELAIGSDTKIWKWNSIFLNVLVEAVVDLAYIEAVIRLLARRYADKIRRLNISQVEFTISLKATSDATSSIAYRFVCHNPTGFVLQVDTYEEKRDTNSNRVVFKAINIPSPTSTPKGSSPSGSRSSSPNVSPFLSASLAPVSFSSSSSSSTPRKSKGAWDGQDIYTAYPVETQYQKQRERASLQDTVYVYDFLALFEYGVRNIWRARYKPEKHLPPGGNQKTGTLGEKGDASLLNPSILGADRTKVNTLRAHREMMQHLKNLEDASSIPDTLLHSVELILSAPDPITGEVRLEETKRPSGLNDIGMIAWRVNLFTPEYRANPGRELVIIANDITHQAGTFGPQEDLLFNLASQHARERGIPRIYLAANSGARIGLAEELRHKFKAAHVDDNPLKPLQYLFLTPADYGLYAKSVNATQITIPETNEVRYRIDDVIGIKEGLGVENLRGSGLIAGETSLAYDEIFTLTYVTGRTVGIGAYLARLGQRCIQKQSPPIILTGFNALNKLLGKTVYTSNVQLGGPEIMYTNGVSHLVVNDDFEGVRSILNWLSYVPSSRSQLLSSPLSLPISQFLDPIDRTITFFPPSKAGLVYDCRHLLTGTLDERTGDWLGGFADYGSFMEVLGGWARGVVAGRARLGGFPIGVILVETRTIEQIVPADPACPSSTEQVLQRAGQVWYPDSAHKTATAIFDMQAEDLPLFLFANWRGFSGGMRDMFEEILKFGAYIVDALRAYTQPVFVYIPPNGQLRGGAWVVVDSTINEQYMEMYADDSARGGVLETEGTLDVKFRKKDILAQAHRLDPELKKLDAELKEAKEQQAKSKAGDAPANSTPAEGGKSADGVDSKQEEKSSASPPPSTRSVSELQLLISRREEMVFPVYHQIATTFADLHDTPGRMMAKNCIRKNVPWAEARKVFYWRLKRRLGDLKWVKSLQKEGIGAGKNWKEAQKTLVEWVRQGVANKVAPDSSPSLSIPVKRQSAIGQTLLSTSSTFVSSDSAFESLFASDQAWSEWLESRRSYLASKLSAVKRAAILEQTRNLINSLRPSCSSTAASSSASAGSDPLVSAIWSVLDVLTPEQKASLGKLASSNKQGEKK